MIRQVHDPVPEIHPYLASCSSCRDRWERARQLYVAMLGRPDEAQDGASTVYAGMLSPVGVVWVAAGARGLQRVDCNIDELTFRHGLEQAGLRARYAPSELISIMGWLSDYFVGCRAVPAVSLDLTGVTPFRASVLRAVAAIPWGEVRSYGEIAGAVDRPGAARAVGSTMATNPLSIVIPCHRVIRGDGTPGEYGYRALRACGTAVKQALLAAEGVMFNTQVDHGSEPAGC